MDVLNHAWSLGPIAGACLNGAPAILAYQLPVDVWLGYLSPASKERILRPPRFEAAWLDGD